MIALTPNGKFVYVANNANNTVSAYSVDATGQLTWINNYPTGSIPYGIAITPDCKFVYVTNNSGNDVSACMIQSTGELIPIIGSFATGSSPLYIAIG